MKELEEQIASVEVEDEDAVSEYIALRKQQKALRGEMRAISNAPKHTLPFLSAGRVVRLLCGARKEGEGEEGEELEGDKGGGDEGRRVRRELEEETVWGVVVNFKKVQRKLSSGERALLSEQ